MFKLSKVNSYGVHDGEMHADDVFSGALISLCNPNVKVVRSRNAYVLKNCELLVDVGNGEYDHHKLPKRVRPESHIPYCGLGLLWDSYANEVVTKVLLTTTKEEIAYIKSEVEHKLIKYIDGMDNGFDLLENVPTTEMLPTLPIIMGLYNKTNSTQDLDYLKARDFASQVLKQLILECSKCYRHIINQGISIKSYSELLHDLYLAEEKCDSFYFTQDQDAIWKVLEEQFVSELRGVINAEQSVIRACLNKVYEYLSRIPRYEEVQGFKVKGLEKIYDIPTYDFIFSLVISKKYFKDFIYNLAYQEYKKQEAHKVLSDLVRFARERDINYILLDEYIPYQEVLPPLNKDQQIKYIIYRQQDSYCLQIVRSNYNQFATDLHFPSSWGGLTGTTLAVVSGIRNLTFCHSNCTFLVSKSLEDLLLVTNFVK